MKKGNGIFVLGVAILLLFGAYALYTFFQKNALSDDLTRLERELSSMQETALQYENRNVLAAITAKETSTVLKADAVKWSEVIKAVRATVPKDKGDQLLSILSYSGSSNKDISLNVKTLPGSEEPYLDVADFIESFDDTPQFKENFVSSVSGGKDKEGNDVLSFLFSTHFDSSAEANPVSSEAQETQSTRSLR